jgi:hypothetical protein
VFSDHKTVTDPDPLPLVGDTVSHDPFPLAVHSPPVQPVGAIVIVTDCEPAENPGLADEGAIEKMQGGASRATAVGTNRFSVVPSPSWPELPRPQHAAPPPVVAAHVWSAPAAMAATPEVRPMTATGTVLEVLVPSPSWP